MGFRKATMNDAKMLFDWRNDQLTRTMSLNASPVDWDKHVAWLSRRLSASDHGLYIFEIGEEPIGTVRIDGDEISYTVSPSQRGKGIGQKMLLAAKDAFGQKIARIKQGNVASIKVAERAGHFVSIIE